MKWLAFDLEIFKLIPDGESDWKAHRPLGISCAATLCVDEPVPLLWHADEKSGAMSPIDCRALVRYLEHQRRDGYTIITWNGLGFDFDILAEESQMHFECCVLAMGHVDMMFQFFCQKGFPLGLDACAKGCGLPGKMEGMDGSQASALGQDVITTLRIAETVRRNKGFSWTARSGRQNHVRIDEWLTVGYCLHLPAPDTSWMSDPWTRDKFTGWMHHAQHSTIPSSSLGTMDTHATQRRNLGDAR